MEHISEDISILEIDLFCGAGGVTTGSERARVNGKKVCKTIACVNHDENAIKSHAANHFGVKHFTEDIRTLDMTELADVAIYYRKQYPAAKLLLWASLECTNFSKAKGGLPREADSRTLADHLFRYIIALEPDIIGIENVEEFMSWGPLNDNGKPVSRFQGKDYLRWTEKVKSFGYDFDNRLLVSADFGAYTTRKRFFGQFVKYGLPISWPEPSHSKDPKRDLFGQLQKWKPVREVLDLEDEGKSIFNRKIPLVEKTLERIYYGLVKFVPSGQKEFISNYYSGSPECRNTSLYNPCLTVRTNNCQSIVKAKFLQSYYGNGGIHSVDAPCPTVSTHDRFSKVTCQFLLKYYSGHPESKNISIDGPAATIKTKDNHSLVSCQFLDKQYGSGKHNIQDIDSPSGSITSVPKLNLVSAKWIMDTSFKNVGTGLDNPAPTVLASRKHHYLMDAQYGRIGWPIDKPCFTLIARMDKIPPYLISATEKKQQYITIQETDSPYMRKIKEFMIANGISDILMRMLKIVELKRIMGFGDSYVLVGSQADQKKFIGNAVEVTTAQALIESISKGLLKLKINKVA